MRSTLKFVAAVFILAVSLPAAEPRAKMPSKVASAEYRDVEVRLKPLAKELGKPKPGEWLFEHKEAGQSFAEYLQSQPIRRSSQWNTIHICVIGDVTTDQQRVIDITRDYLEIVFDTPVKVGTPVPLAEIPASAQRTNPQTDADQILSKYVLDDILKVNRPGNALASLAFTSHDLWPGKGWNFVFGQASLRERTGVWSMHRFGDPSRSKEAFQLCLGRTLGTAAHETSHILSMPHCKTYVCSLNGSNNLTEADQKPLHLCPVCLRKLCWNLQVDPVTYLGKLEAFCRKHAFDEDADWYRRAIEVLKKE